MYLDMTSVLDTFAVDVTVYPKASDGQWVDGQWVDGTAGDPVTYHEPVVPNGLVGKYSIVSLLRDTGKTEQYNAVWLSSRRVETGTVVEQGGKKYKIADVTDLTSYSNVLVYYLESEEGDEDGV